MWYLILALLIWSSSFVAGKAAFEMLDPVLTVQSRFIIISIILLPVFIKHWRKVNKSLRPRLWLLGFLNYPLVGILQYLGLSLTSASSAITIIGLEPLLVVFIGHFFYKDKACWFHWLFGLVAFIGVALLVKGDTTGGEISLLGCTLMFISCSVFAFCLRITQRMLNTIGSAAYTPISIVLGMITCIPFSLVLTQSWTIHFSWIGLFGLLYLGVGCSWLAYVLWNKGLPQTDSNVAGILTALEPIFGVVLAMILLGEKVSLLSWSGIALIMLSTIGSSLLTRYLKPASQQQ